MTRLLVVLLLASCTRPVSEPARSPEPMPHVAVVPEASPVLKQADKTVAAAIETAGDPEVDTGQAIKTLELAARLRNDIHKARRVRSKKVLRKVRDDTEALKDTIHGTR